jgi:ribonucleoside-diphosphate reductase alpha chain
MTLEILEDISHDLEHVHLEEHADKLYLNDLDELSKQLSDRYYLHYQWNILAARVVYAKLLRTIPATFSESMMRQKEALHPDYLKYVLYNASKLNEMVCHLGDVSNFEYFGMKTLERSYLGRIFADKSSKIVVESPQYMYLRIATFLHQPDMERIRRTYDDLSKGRYSHASPTMFNSGMKCPAMSSCFTMNVEDNLDHILQMVKYEGLISKNAGGIGKSYSNVRHSKIGTSGDSKGIIPFIKIDNETMLATDQSGKRKGSLAVYLKVWHVDLIEFIELRDTGGSEYMRARDIFCAVAVNDLFMKRAVEGGDWCLFCPREAPRLNNTFGKEFEMQYLSYERQGIYKFKHPAREIFKHLVLSVIKTGGPYMINLDAINRKCNQTHNGDMVHLSNLCTEIAGVTNEKEIFSCNLGSIVLNSCVFKNDKGEMDYDWALLRRLTKDMVRNLNETIDRNYYPEAIKEIRYANFKRRPLGIGVQGLADTFALMNMVWEDENQEIPQKTREFHQRLFEEMYVAGIQESIDIAREDEPYPSFKGSPSSKGLLQPDLWEIEKLGVTEEEYLTNPKLKFVYKHTPKDVVEKMYKNLKIYGLRNSLIFALMPTATSAHILGNNECFEPFNGVLFSREVLGGKYPIINKYFIDECFARGEGKWNTELLQHLMDNDGMIDTYDFAGKWGISPSEDTHLKLKYKSVYDIRPGVILQLAADRGKYVCQTQSQNLHIRFKGDAEKDYETMVAYYIRAWDLGLKTYMYYFRQHTNGNAINFAKGTLTITNESTSKNTESECTSCAL